MNRNTDNFQKIPVKKKPKVGHRDGWKLVRKLQRRGKLFLQEKVHAVVSKGVRSISGAL